MTSLKVAYADPPYVGMSKKHYGDHPDYAGEVDHAELVQRLERDYDGWALHCHVPSLHQLLPLMPEGVRVCAWTKTFATFKRNVPVAYAWEPVLVKACRKPVVSGRISPLRDWFAAPVALTKGFAGAKPESVCKWVFEVLGMEPQDKLDDLYPGTGAVTRAWASWRDQLRLELAPPVCSCGHAADWHAYGGMGDCEHDADCGCASFRTPAKPKFDGGQIHA